MVAIQARIQQSFCGPLLASWYLGPKPTLTGTKMGIWTGPWSRKVQWWHADVDDGLTRYLGRWLVHKNAAVHDGSRRGLQSAECWGNACEEVALLQPRGLWLQWKERNYRLGPFFFFFPTDKKYMKERSASELSAYGEGCLLQSMPHSHVCAVRSQLWVWSANVPVLPCECCRQQ